MQNYHTHFPVKQTPQSQPIPGSTQVPNNAGGFGWQVDDWTRLHRFLILGAEGGTYYVGEKELTQQNAQAALRCIEADGTRVVREVIDVSSKGRAPSNDPALFVLALCASLGNKETKQLALASLPMVARIGTHLFHFVTYVQSMRGWGRGLRRAIQNWYLSKVHQELVYDLTKYQSRDGWSHRDLLRLAHPKPDSIQQTVAFNWAVKGTLQTVDTPYKVQELDYLAGAHELLHTQDKKRAAELIVQYNLPRECVPTQFLNDPGIWEVLLNRMPITAMVRNLGNMSKVGLLTPMSTAAATVIAKLADTDQLRRSRIHPMQLLVALKQYAMGHGLRGSGIWTPVPQVVDILDASFYTSFGNVTPTGKKFVLGVDGSGSMQAPCHGTEVLSAREAAAAMAMITIATEPNYAVCAFTTRLHHLTLSPRTRLDDAVRQMYIAPEGTDGSIPLLWAKELGVQTDCVILYTDNESWAGSMHVAQALQLCRDRVNPQMKLVTMSMTSNHVTVADPNDVGSLNVVGFDTTVPQVISDFVGD